MAEPTPRTLTDDSLRVEVWGDIPGRRSNVRLCVINDPMSVTLNLRFNKIGSAELVVPSDYGADATTSEQSISKREALRGATSWIEVYLRGRRIFTGPITEVTLTGPSDGTITAKCESHLRMLWTALVEPGSRVAGESGTFTYDSAERQVISGAGTGWGGQFLDLASKSMPHGWVMGPNIYTSGSRSPFGVRLKATDVMLEEFVGPPESTYNSMLGVDVAPDGARRTLILYKPATFVRVLTDRSGVVVDWEYTRKRRRGDRAIAGGQGEGIERIFAETWYTTTSPDDKGAVFVDARDADTSTVEGRQKLKGRATHAVVGAKVSLKATLAEGLGFRFVTDFWMGDMLTFSLAEDTAKITSRVTEVAIDWTRDQGLIVTPKVGDITDSAEAKIVQAIRGIGQRTTNLETR